MQRIRNLLGAGVTTVAVGLLTFEAVFRPTTAVAQEKVVEDEKPSDDAAKPWTPEELKAAIKALDDRQRNSGDYKTQVYIERKEKNKNDVVLEAVVYRRDADDKLMILFTNPKAEKGKGYLRIDKNLWMYDPGVGKWERRTEREKIGGTDSRRADFDESRLSEEYEAKYEGVEKLGKFQAHKVTLTAKKGVDVAYPKQVLWLSPSSGNTLKRQEYAASGKLMRTSYTPKWAKRFSESKKADVWTPKEIRIFDEVEKGNSTVILMKEMDLRSLPANLFTKAWLESQSR
ncbi:MAG: outer membrane lipoprotein-sorting protein [Deltaproteobacteria bacterium]|nr:outer membrane lipoprotein-sorting protein [Deltaproteobacteria bacterium]